MQWRRTGLLAAVALAALPLGAAACGGSGKHGSGGVSLSASVAVLQAVRKTVDAGSEHVSLTTTVNAGAQSLSLAGAGDFNTKNGVGSLRATFAVAGVRSTLDEVTSGSKVYVRSPFFATILRHGKRWLFVDVGTARSVFGPAASSILAQDPSAIIAELEALGSVKDVGSEEVGGTKTTHYEATITDSKLLGPSIPIDVWVGADGYVRKLRVTASSSSSKQRLKTAVTMNLSNYGKTVHVSTPPASATVDASKVSIPGLGG